MSGTRADVLVIGAGHNGLVAASYLAKAGRRVVVVEKRSSAGGCLATEEVWPGYSVDIGTQAMGEFDARIAKDLGLRSQGCEFLRPDPVLVAPAQDGTALCLSRNVEQTVTSIRRFSERDGRRWPSFVDSLTKASRTLERLYALPLPQANEVGAADAWSLLRFGVKLGRAGRKDVFELMRLLPMSAEELLDEWFESELLKGALAVDAVRGICRGPFAPGTGFPMLHLGVGSTAWPPGRVRVKGGMGQLGEALLRTAVSLGAEVRLGEEVTRIVVDRGQATGVELASGDVILAGTVLSCVAPRTTLLELLDPAVLSPETRRAARNIRARGACAAVHVAFSGLLGKGETADESELAVAQGALLTLAPSLRYMERAADDAKYGHLSRKPIIEAVATTALDPHLAPVGHNIVSALVHYVPSGAGATAEGQSGRDEERVPPLDRLVIDALAPHLPALSDGVTHTLVQTPAVLADAFGLPEGDIYHAEMTLDQAFFGRPGGGLAKYRSPIDGLFLSGAGTHLGGGINGRPGAAAASVILNR